MRVGLDLDGCLFNFGQSVKDYLEATGQDHLWKSGPTAKPYWDWYKDWKWTTPQFLDFCHAGADAGYIFRGNIRDNALEAVWRIYKEGHDIIVITDRGFGTTPEVSHQATRDWWKEYDFPPYTELHFSADKTIAQTDIFVEDKLSNYDAITAAGTECWLINRPWNDEDVNDGRNRIDDILDYVDKVNEKAEVLVN